MKVDFNILAIEYLERGRARIAQKQIVLHQFALIINNIKECSMTRLTQTFADKFNLNLLRESDWPHIHGNVCTDYSNSLFFRTKKQFLFCRFIARVCVFEMWRNSFANYFRSIFCMDFLCMALWCSCEGASQEFSFVWFLCVWHEKSNRLRRAWCGVDGTTKQKPFFMDIFKQRAKHKTKKKSTKHTNWGCHRRLSVYVDAHGESITLKLICGIDIFNYRFLSLAMIKTWLFRLQTVGYSKQYILFSTIHLCLGSKSLSSVRMWIERKINCFCSKIVELCFYDVQQQCQPFSQYIRLCSRFRQMHD